MDLYIFKIKSDEYHYFIFQINFIFFIKILWSLNTKMRKALSRSARKNKYRYLKYTLCVKVMVMNVTFNNNSILSWRAVLLMLAIGVPRVHQRPAVSH